MNPAPANLISRLKNGLGDFWWYSALIFMACRTGDLIQAFIGLWLVPKYVGAEELGAVLPLQQLTAFLTFPLGVAAVVFAKYVNVYATRGEYGKVKCFIRDVLVSCLLLFGLCIGAAYLLMPFFYERLRISPGALTFLILACGLVTNLGAIVSSCQQGLKRFATMSAMHLLGAPVRLVTLLIAMPFRPLSGYVVGQTTPAAATSLLALLDIRKVLKPHAFDASWRADLPEIWRFFARYALCSVFGALAGSLTVTVYRQRLPEIESAAYYMLTRFSDIASFVAATLGVVLFPLASEAHESGKESPKLMWYSVAGILVSCIALAAFFRFAAAPILSLNALWREYLPFAYLLPLLTLTVGFATAAAAVANYELACNRFSLTVIFNLANIAFAALLVSFTGAEFFRGILPDAAVDWMRNCAIAKLRTLTFLSLSYNAALFTLLALSARLTGRANPRTARRNCGSTDQTRSANESPTV